MRGAAAGRGVAWAAAVAAAGVLAALATPPWVLDPVTPPDEPAPARAAAAPRAPKPAPAAPAKPAQPAPARAAAPAPADAPAPAAAPAAPAAVVSTNALPPPPALAEGQIETTADRLNYDRERGVVEGIGHVLVRRGDVELRADYVRVELETEKAQAFGDVTLTRGTDVWKGSKLDYDFSSGAVASDQMQMKSAPFYVRAERSERVGDNRYVLYDAWASTCDPDSGPVDFHVSAGRMELVQNEYLKARNAIWWFGPVPTFYVPYWYRSLDEDFGFTVEPGYRSRDGAFVLTSYKYRLTPHWTARTHVDYREKRGVAGGQDFRWNYNSGEHTGLLKSYYADDREPLEDEDITAGKEIDSDRYRVKITDNYVLGPRDVVLTRAHYLSDIDIVEDFFRKEYRNERQPDNYVSYTHRGDRYTAGVLARARLNDFFGNVNRLPEAHLELYQQQIGESDFYYESQTAAAFLQRVYEDSSANEDYESFRFDTEHTVSYPDKLFGFLTVIPRIGARATYYSATPEPVYEVKPDVHTTNFVVDANGTTNAVVTTAPGGGFNLTGYQDGDAETRGVVQLGMETSYKAFGLYDTPFGARRHIVEPFANYTLIPEPNVLPEDLYQFDSVDSVGESHFVRFGARNKWQEKRETGAFDLADVAIYTDWLIHREDDQESFEFIYWDAEFRPVDPLGIALDGAYSLSEDVVDTFNTRVDLFASPTLEFSVLHRYRFEESSLLFGDVTFYPEAKWSLNTYGRYEFEEDRLDEAGGGITHRFTCVAVKLGGNYMPSYERSDGTKEKEEYEYMLEFWLTAFPKNVVGGTHTEERE